MTLQIGISVRRLDHHVCSRLRRRRSQRQRFDRLANVGHPVPANQRIERDRRALAQLQRAQLRVAGRGRRRAGDRQVVDLAREPVLAPGRHRDVGHSRLQRDLVSGDAGADVALIV